ncbi:MAG: segregation/condensation protein A, partial [Deltaproteobacteria bacterium]|nr:segregation/condensation protein A [Deltaproteobacteria bacterium]
SNDRGDLPDDPSVAVEGSLRGAGNYGVKLPVFEGPLDLLLHLIRQNEVDIIDIQISQIADQYLEYLEMMRSLDLDIAAEYLVMAATLAHIKSRMLLPPSPDEEGDDSIDPRAELVARLLEYQRYKEVAEALSRRRWLGRDVYEAQGAGPEKTPDAERQIEVGLFELIEAFRLVLKAVPEDSESHVHVVESEEVTVRDRMMFVMIATFLAILELTRLEALSIYQGVNEQGSPDGAIRLRAILNADQVSWNERITELM